MGVGIGSGAAELCIRNGPAVYCIPTKYLAPGSGCLGGPEKPHLRHHSAKSGVARHRNRLKRTASILYEALAANASLYSSWSARSHSHRSAAGLLGGLASARFGHGGPFDEGQCLIGRSLVVPSERRPLSPFIRPRRSRHSRTSHDLALIDSVRSSRHAQFKVLNATPFILNCGISPNSQTSGHTEPFYPIRTDRKDNASYLPTDENVSSSLARAPLGRIAEETRTSLSPDLAAGV